MKNLIWIATVIVTSCLLLTSNPVKAQGTFTEFVSEVNTTTGIATNDYQSNVAKIEKLGVATQTLWQLYVSGYRIATPTTKVVTVEGVINPTIATTPVEILYPTDTDTATVVKIPSHIVLDTLTSVVNTVEETPIATIALAKGDIILVARGYREFTVVGKPTVHISSRKFDALYDSGLIAPKRNRQWVYVGKALYHDGSMTKLGLGDGFLSIIFVLVCLLFIGQQLGKPKIVTANNLAEEVKILQSTNKKLAQEVQDKSGEVKTLKAELAKRQATIDTLSIRK